MKSFLLLMGIMGILLGSSSVMASSASLYYSDGPWMGRVIDAETKEPIEGAVVLAVWNKVYGTPTGRQSYFFDAVEVLTDREGRFFIEKYRALNILPVIRWIEGPYFTIFKPGYTPFGNSYNYFNKYFPKSPLRVDVKTLSDIFKKDVTVNLFKLKTKEERLKSETEILPLISVPYNKMPILIKFINMERKELGLDPIPLKE